MAGSGAWPLLLVLVAACGSSDIDGPAPRRSVTFGLVHGSATANQVGCVRAISAAALSLTADDGDHLDRQQTVDQAATSVTFDDLDIHQGSVRFVASVTSDNGTELYAKDTTIQIDSAAFNVAFTLDKRSPVLEVCPGRIDFTRSNEFSAAMEVQNPGIDTLTYQAESAECPDACMQFFTPTGSVVAGGSGTIFAGLIHWTTLTTLQMHVRSPVGSVGVDVSLQPFADVVVQDFRATDTLRINGQGLPEIPVSVTLRNGGNATAPIFKISAEYDNTNSNQTDTVNFAVPDGDGEFAFTPAPLAPGESLTMTGAVVWPGTQDHSHGLTLFRLRADSCVKESSAEFFCRVEEFDESNNLSGDLPVTLP
jgi:hypothetical protein